MEILCGEEESRLSLTNIKHDLECVICFDVPKHDPVYHCENEHILCDTCNEKVTECPVCRMKLGRSRNSVVKAVLVKCPTPPYFKKDGCSVTLTETDATKHQNNCNCIPVLCVHPGCKEMVPMAELAAHIDDQHEVRCHFKTKQFTIVYKHIKTSLSTESQFGPSRLSFNGFHFFTSVWRNFSPQSRWFIWLYIVGTTDESKNYVYTVKITGSEFNEVITYTGQTISVQIGREQVCSTYRCLTFDDEIAKRLCKNDRLKIIFNLHSNISS